MGRVPDKGQRGLLVCYTKAHLQLTAQDDRVWVPVPAVLANCTTLIVVHQYYWCVDPFLNSLFPWWWQPVRISWTPYVFSRPLYPKQSPCQLPPPPAICTTRLVTPSAAPF